MENPPVNSQAPLSCCIASIETQTRGAEIRKKVSGEGLRAPRRAADHPVCTQRSGIQPKNQKQTRVHSQAASTSKDCVLPNEDHRCNTFFPFLLGEKKGLSLCLNYRHSINNGNSISNANCGHKWHIGSWLPQNPVWSRRLVPTSDGRFGNKYRPPSVQGHGDPASLNMAISWKDFFPIH